MIVRARREERWAGERPVERVARLYEGGAARSFREDLEAHLLNGYVVSTPECFIMGRAVCSQAEAAEIRDPWRVFAEGECDAWLIYAFAGNVNTGLTFFPKPLSYVAWERNGKNGLRFWEWTRFWRACVRYF